MIAPGRGSGNNSGPGGAYTINPLTGCCPLNMPPLDLWPVFGGGIY